MGVFNNTPATSLAALTPSVGLDLLSQPGIVADRKQYRLPCTYTNRPW